MSRKFCGVGGSVGGDVYSPASGVELTENV